MTTTVTKGPAKAATAKSGVRTKKAQPVATKPQDEVWRLEPAKRHVLANVPVPVEFDPENKKHREAFAAFLVNKQWPDGVRFQAEWPHTSAVTTIQTKLTHYALRKELTAVVAANNALSKASTTLSSITDPSFTKE